MVLSASDMGIREGLIPFFCSKCGCRLGWYDNGYSDIDAITFCEDCAKEDVDDEED